jgi:4-diphosphocytidyl-2-C-methyl-D-erythritol kinase
LTFTRQAPAKLNLGLHVLRRRDDGYHDLQTVFVPIPWADTLAAVEAPDLRLACSEPALPTDAGNLVVRAAEALRLHTGTPRGAALHLDKRLPHGAGLGGGSSDAATALLLLCDLWGLAMPDADLQALARSLGADVPFFLDPRPALATGIGDVLTPLLDDDGAPYRLPYPLVVAVPPAAVSTAGAYRHVAPRADGRPDLAAAVRSNDLDRWRRDLVNDFEAPIVAAYPALGPVRAALYDAGAGYASMSGSGAGFFGVFEDDARALAAAEALRYAGCTVWHGMAMP